MIPKTAKHFRRDATTVRVILLAVAALLALSVAGVVLFSFLSPIQLGAQPSDMQILPAATIVSRDVEPVPEGFTLILHREYPTWQYAVTKETKSSRVVAAISYDRNSIQGLKDFSNANKSLADQLAPTGGKAHVIVTFRRPIPAAEFRSWVEHNQLTVQESQLREAVGRVTVGVKGSDADPLPQAALDGLFHGPITGVINTNCSVDVTRLPQIAADALVFLSDVTPTIVEREMKQAQIPDSDKIDIATASPYYVMETLGLGNF